jgi:hypothetical protein
LLVNCVTKVCSDTLEESFANVPARAYAFPFFFFAFSLVGGGCVINCAVVGVRFRFLGIGADASLMVVFVDS